MKILEGAVSLPVFGKDLGGWAGVFDSPVFVGTPAGSGPTRGGVVAGPFPDFLPGPSACAVNAAAPGGGSGVSNPDQGGSVCGVNIRSEQPTSACAVNASA